MDKKLLFLFLVVAIIGSIILFGILYRLFFAGDDDKNRIKKDAESKGFSLVSIEWAPFAPGWWAENSERMYKVVLKEKSGGIKEVYCKTSSFTGVYWKM